MHPVPPSDRPASPSRRNALKWAGATAVGVTVWSEPTLRGIARRPAYAQGASGGVVVFDVSTSIGPGKTYTDTVSGETLTITRSAMGNTNVYEFSCSGGGTVTVNITIGANVYSVTGPNPVTINDSQNGTQTVTGTVVCA